MSNLLLYLAESGTCLLLFYGLYALALRHETGFAYNRFYLLVTPLLACLLPFAELPFLERPEPLTIFISEQLAPLTISGTVPAPQPKITFFTWPWVWLLLYLAGFCFFCYRLVRQLSCLRLFTRQTRADCFFWQNIPVHKTQGAQPTFSFGHRIFWDNSQPLSPAEIEQIFLHEAIHVRQKHSRDILYLEGLSILFWFNPLFYLYKKALISTHEFIADAAVLQTTHAVAYAHLLAKQVLHRLEFSFGHFFNQSLTLKRMNMLKQIHRRPSKLKQLLALPVLGIGVFILSCAETETPTTPVVNSSTPDTHSSALGELLAPQFPGGRQALYEYLVKNIQYPAAESKDLFIVRTVTIGRNGEVLKQAANPDDDAFVQEVKRLINHMPAWKPATKAGKPIEAGYVLAFSFNPTGFKEDGKKEPFIDTRKAELLNKPKADLPIFSASDIVIHDGNEVTVGQLNNTAPDKNQAQNEPVFTQVEELPTFPGGLEKMYEFLSKNIKYPEAAKMANLEGTVVVQFIITAQGNIKDIHILKGLSSETHAEAIRVMKLMPNWTPGKQNGKPVNVQYTLPLRFSLEAAKPEENTKSLQTGYINWAKPLVDNC